MIKISVVTVNYNNCEGLRRTIESVINQTYSNVQYLVIDGGSTDNSKEIIQNFSCKIDCWVSEKDNGVYHAMNKGILSSNGKYLLFLNSGDRFSNEYSLANLIKASVDRDIVYGNLVVEDTDKNWIKHYPEQLPFSYFLTDTLPHPATLIKRDLFNNGGYNESLKIVSDWEFFVLSICKNGADYVHVDEAISIFKRDGISSMSENMTLIEQEKRQSLERYFPAFLNDYRDYNEIKAKYELLVNSRAHQALSKLRQFKNVKHLFK